MNKRRLLKLANMLEADARNKKGVQFDLRTVVTPDPNLPADTTTIPVSCGTKACAMGLAAISGEFRRAGLSYTVRPSYWGDGILIDTTMHGENVDYDDAATALFGISHNESEFLFHPDSYPSRSAKTGMKGELVVARRIRDFVAGKAAPKVAA